MPARILALVCVFVMQARVLQAQDLHFDGIYSARTGHVSDSSADIHTYLRFYPDGAVILQSVTSGDARSVAGWFGRYKQYAQKGTYTMQNGQLVMQLTNEKAITTGQAGGTSTYLHGKLVDGRLELTDTTDCSEFSYAFHSVQDTTVVKYNRYQPELRLAGEWFIREGVRDAKQQVTFTNADSTVIAICVMPGEALDVFVRERTDFENALAYYNWDSRTLRDEARMTVRKLSENREKAYICWQAKNGQQNMYFLFGTRGNLLFNCMIKAPDMPEQDKIDLLEKVYEMNHL
ncbi:hypothetical protein [Chitinophaga sp.]|uniref:hypothetical protein n=1 Tax=Chitinophaga sp. TaxID=1869181 RepID=UPI0026195B30|nr:hypothetical protein [uncultured Chitinophaga sp.]